MSTELNIDRSLQADIDSVASSVAKRKMEVPAIFFLEAHRPVLSLANHAATVLMPTLSMFISTKSISAFQRVLESQDAIEALINKLESGVAV